MAIYTVKLLNEVWYDEFAKVEVEADSEEEAEEKAIELAIFNEEEIKWHESSHGDSHLMVAECSLKQT